MHSELGASLDCFVFELFQASDVVGGSLTLVLQTANGRAQSYSIGRVGA